MTVTASASTAYSPPSSAGTSSTSAAAASAMPVNSPCRVPSSSRTVLYGAARSDVQGDGEGADPAAGRQLGEQVVGRRRRAAPRWRRRHWSGRAPGRPPGPTPPGRRRLRGAWRPGRPASRAPGARPGPCRRRGPSTAARSCGVSDSVRAMTPGASQWSASRSRTAARRASSSSEYSRSGSVCHRARSFQATSLSVRGSAGRPRTRSATMFSRTSLVPPSMLLPLERR